MYEEHNENTNLNGSQMPYSSYEIAGETHSEPKTKKKSGGFKKVVTCMALGLIFGGFGALGFFGVNTIANSSVQKADAGAKSAKAETTPVKEVEPVAVHESDKIENTIQSDTSIEAWDVTDVVEEVMPTVVSITNQSTQEATNFFGQTQEYESETSGSGIIVGQNDSELLVVTNNHVADDATTLSVQFIDGSSVNGKMKGGDSEVDLAIVAIPLADIDSDTMDEIKIATLGESEALEVGEPAIAIGNALGYGQSVTTGVISAINREITIDNHTSVLIQTDAAINPGNSGGALLNMKGEVIGINAAKFGSSMIEGMGYAIPISQAKPIINDLMNRETRDKVALGEESYLGISGVDVTEEVAQTYDMPIGVYVAQALEGTAAEEAGIQKGDIITKFDGQSITSMAELQETLTYYPAGTTIDVTIKRADGDQYREEKVTVTLGSKENQNS